MNFSKQAFRAWLESKTDRTRVGRPEHTEHCPLCQFLKEQGADHVRLHMTFRLVDGKQTSNPEWAFKFQRAACDYVKENVERNITAKTALSFL